MRSVMSHSFSMVPRAEIQRSSFNRSHGVKTTFDAGYLVPILVDEVLPGDTFNLRTSGFCRLSTPLYPVMDNMFLETFYFAVPKRLVWDNWQKMMGEQDNPGDSTDYVLPKITAPTDVGYAEQTLFDYFGLPTKTPGLEHTSLPLRCYNLIYNEWFRDQNLQDSVLVRKTDGPDFPTDYSLLRRGKRHDYFTSCLPWPQKGDAVEIPIGGTQAPVTGLGYGIDEPGISQGVAIKETGWEPGDPGRVFQNPFSPLTGSGIFAEGSADGTDASPLIYADLTEATAVTINQLRVAFQVQKMYERDARGGTRYTEIIRSHFNVVSPDARLQRPEFLGGGSTPINVTPIAATARDDTGQPGEDINIGDLGAMGTVSFNGHGFTKSFTEHCYIIGLANVRADLTYQQGLNRMWSREDRLDFYWPALAHIGEQEVLNKEIYAQGNADPIADDEVFGYQERYAEYRYKPSTIHGLFRSNAAQSLDAWHLSQEFENLPLLNSTFIADQPPLDRVIAVPSEPHFIGDFYHKLHCARPMPLFGVPGNIDRF